MFAARDAALATALAFCRGHRPTVATSREILADREQCLPTWHVHNKDTLDVALSLSNPLVLILADAKTPGGNVMAGAGMQEESLFRRTALFSHLTPDMYPIGDGEALYAPDVPVLMDSDYIVFQTPYRISFIACPGIQFPRLVDGRNCFTDADADRFKNRVRLILQVAQRYRHANVVLGALGCGVWGCPARHVAELFAEVLREATVSGSTIESVHFAILGATYHVFQEVLGKP